MKHKVSITRHKPMTSKTIISSNYGRIVLLLVPTIVTVLVLLALSSHHPSTSGSIDIKDGKRLGMWIGRGVSVGGVDWITEIVLRNTPIVLSAERIQLLDTHAHVYKGLRIEPREGAEVAFDLPIDRQVELSFNLEASKGPGVVLKHQEAPEKDGFYVIFDVPSESEFKGHLFIGAGAPSLKATVRGVRLASFDQGSEIRYVDVPATKPMRISIEGTSSIASIAFEVSGGHREDVLTLRYLWPRANSALTLFSDPDPARLRLVPGSPIRVGGEANIFVGGKKLDTYSHVTLRMAGPDIQLRHGLDATTKGFGFILDGVFDDVSIVVAKGQEPILPSMLENLTSLSIILLGAIAFLLDKLIGIYGFLQRSRE